MLQLQIVSSLVTRLEAEFGRGFGKRNLFRMIRIAEVFADFEIVSALRSQLGWTHIRLIIALDDPLPGERSGLELVCIMYAGMKAIAPEADAGFGLAAEHEAALSMLEARERA